MNRAQFLRSLVGVCPVVLGKKRHLFVNVDVTAAGGLTGYCRCRERLRVRQPDGSTIELHAPEIVAPR